MYRNINQEIRIKAFSSIDTDTPDVVNTHDIYPLYRLDVGRYYPYRDLPLWEEICNINTNIVRWNEGIGNYIPYQMYGNNLPLEVEYYLRIGLMAED